MPQPKTRKTHKFAINVRGLTDEQAAQLFYMLTSCATAFTYGDKDRYEAASNVPLKVLRAEYPTSEWVMVSKKDRIGIAT